MAAMVPLPALVVVEGHHQATAGLPAGSAPSQGARRATGDGMRDAAVRMGVDIGGTFTDVVLDAGGRLHSVKVLTTYDAPEDAILEGMTRACAAAGVSPGALTQIVHGTTLATNALIERRGARTALITTAGFRDVIEMRTESRFEQYDLDLELPPPLLPRDMRHVVSERMDADGGVLLPLDRAEVERVAGRLAAEGVESVAVGLLHSYANAAHERLVGEVLAERMPGAHVSLSCEVSPQMREYERFNTTVANAYVMPLMASYLGRLTERLAAAGATCPVFLMHSGGGIMSLESARRFPVRLVESGPAGGAIFAAEVARRHGIGRALAFDMGGTTAKICLIRDGAPKTARVFEVARSYRFKKGSGMPISIPVIDMVEIGAGGGSLASVDAMGRVAVGPRSAGSEPGPACYGRGGTRPAVTDADLVLGRLDPDGFAGGTIPLDRGAAEAALAADVGEPLGLSAEDAARGVAEVVDEAMAGAARMHAVENGEDLSGYAMVAFGGAAPLHAARLCEKLGIARCLVPEGAGVGSAIGFLRAPYAFEASRSEVMRLGGFDPGRAADVLQELAAEAEGFVRSCDAEADVACAHRAWMRYDGQGWEIPVDLPPEVAAAPDADALRALFEAGYARLFGRAVEGMEVLVASWSVGAATAAPGAAEVPEAADAPAPAPGGTRAVADPGTGEAAEAALHRRWDLPPGARLAGPAVVTEDETALVVPPGGAARVLGDGTLELTVGPAAAAAEPGEVAHQVMWTRLLSVVEEQAQALVRTAFSTSVREAGDLSAGVYDAAGRMLAQAVTGTPGHVNAMAEAVAHFVAAIPEMAEGDVYLTNDPWLGTGHKHDVTVVTPVFRGGRRAAFLACTAHVTDIGGRGFGADANDVHEEGLAIPIMPFARGGEVDATLLAIVRANVREPDQLVGDLHALAACNETGRRRLEEMMDEFALEGLEGVAAFVLERSRAATVERIAALRPGAATGEMRIDGFDAPIDLEVRVEIGADGVTADWAGTSGVDPKGINVPLVYTKAYTCYALKCAIAPEVPNNAGSLAPFAVTAPEGSIVNAPRPAPVALRHVIGHMLPDAVFGALDSLLPGGVPAEGAGCLCNFQLSLRPGAAGAGRRAEVLTFNSGGSGARPGRDGLNATAFPSGVMTMPVEATEHAGPAVIWRKELRPDSGGPGRQRGGLGQVMEVGARPGHLFDMQAMLDRVDHPARGRRGGGPGAPTEIGIAGGGPLRAKGRQSVPEGARVRMAFPGGGGHGPAAERDGAALRRDLAMGYVTPEAAARDYGMDRDAAEAAARGEG